FTIPTAAGAAGKSDFSELAGRYKGPASISIGPESGFGQATVNVKVPRSGRSAIISVFGSVVANGSAIPLSGRIKLRGRRSFAVNSLVFNLLPAPGAQGNFKALRNRTTFSAPWAFDANSGAIRGDIRLSPNGRRIEI